MKKLFLLLLFIVVQINTFAQLNIIEQKEPWIFLGSTVGAADNQYYYIVNDQENYVLCRHVQNAKNNFFVLGKSKSEALKTLEDLISFENDAKIGTVLHVMDARNRKARIIKIDHELLGYGIIEIIIDTPSKNCFKLKLHNADLYIFFHIINGTREQFLRGEL